MEEWLNKLLGDELIAHMQYAIAAQIAKGNESDRAFEEFTQHANEELEHFTKILNYMVSKKIKVNSDLQTLITQSQSGYEIMKETDVKYLVEFHLKAEKNAIKAYTEFLEYLKNKEESELVKIIKEILSDEREHEEDIEKILGIINKLKEEKMFDY